MTLKLAGWSALALAVVFGAGWLVGASGRAELEQDRRDAEARADFADRARVHAGGPGQPVPVEFRARRAARSRPRVPSCRPRADAACGSWATPARAGQLEVALVQLGEAQRLALALDAGRAGRGGAGGARD